LWIDEEVGAVAVAVAAVVTMLALYGDEGGTGVWDG
jgi:hypothetical protein